VLDSLDALNAKADLEKAEKKRNARKTGKKEKGSYGMAKPKALSELLRMIVRRLKDTNSVIIIVSQTRKAIDPDTFETKYRTGGAALEFYSSHVIWLAPSKTIKRKDISVGHQVRAKSTKSKLTGSVRTIFFPVLPDYGVDDVRGMIDWLEEYGYWKKRGNSLAAEPFGIVGLSDTIAKKIEASRGEGKLRTITHKAWMKLEKSIRTNRERRFG